MKSKKIIFLTAIIAFSFLLSSCILPFNKTCLNIAKGEPYNMTPNKAYLICYYAAVRSAFMKEGADDKYKIDYSKVSVKEVLTVIKEMQENTDGFLNNPENKKFIEAMGIKDNIKSKIKAYKIAENNLNLFYSGSEFKNMLNSNYHIPYINDGPAFNVNMILPSDEARNKIKFEVPFIEEARKNGNLHLISEFVLFSSDKLANKKIDEDDMSEQGKITWEKREGGIIVKTFKVYGNQPENNTGDLIEAYRFTFVRGKDGSLDKKIEQSKPCLRAYATALNSGINIAVIDVDTDRSEHGFGYPDFIKLVSSITSGKDFATKEYVDILLPEKPEEKKDKKDQKMLVKIVKAGEASSSVWEKTEDSSGFVVPHVYLNPAKDNYKLALVHKKKWLVEISKTYHSFQNKYSPGVGNVVEHYNAKPPYDGGNIIEVKVLFDEDKKIELSIEGSPVIKGFADIFIKDKPFMIDYTDVLSNVRWQIADLDKNGTYESRRKIPVTPSSVTSEGFDIF